MAKSRKRKKKKNTSAKMSPRRYIIENIRKLPIEKSYIFPDNWQEIGMANAIVLRQHNSGNYTVGFFLIDLLLKGVKDSYFVFNVTDKEFEKHFSKIDLQPVDYDLVHNIVYKSINYAEQYGFNPNSDFSVVRYILEPENAEIQDIPIQFGDEDGKPLLIESDVVKFKNDLLKLRKNAGEGNFHVGYIDPEDPEDNDEDYLEEEEYNDDDDGDVFDVKESHTVKVLVFWIICRKRYDDEAFVIPQEEINYDKLEIEKEEELSLKEEYLFNKIYEIIEKEEINKEKLLTLVREFFKLNQDKSFYSEIISVLFNEGLDDLIEIINEEFTGNYPGSIIPKFYSAVIQANNGNSFPLLSLFKGLQNKKEEIKDAEELIYFYLTGLFVGIEKDNLVQSLSYQGVIVDIITNFELNIYLDRLFDILDEGLTDWIEEYLSSISKKEEKKIVNEVIELVKKIGDNESYDEGNLL